MLRTVLQRSFLLSFGFKIQKFNATDYRTMCALLKQKHPLYNEFIEVHNDIKLMDEKGKLVGRYSASEARRKAASLKKDIVMLNPNSDPIVCKLFNFRESVLEKFYNEIVNKRNESLIKKASTSKQLKISVNLTQNQLQIKAKQIIQLAKKNLNVRVYTVCRQNVTDQALNKFDYLKSLVQSKCVIEKQIRVQEQKQDEDSFIELKKPNDIPNNIISIVLKSKDNQFMNLLSQSLNQDQDSAIQAFLQRYYKQEDVDMKDLKDDQSLNSGTSTLFHQGVLDFIPKAKDAPQVYETETKPKRGEKKQKKTTEAQDEQDEEAEYLELRKQAKLKAQKDKEYEQYLKDNSYIEKQAKARVLNDRLKRILSVQV